MRGIKSILPSHIIGLCQFLANQPDWATFTSEGYGPNRHFVKRILDGISSLTDQSPKATQDYMAANFAGPMTDVELVQAATMLATHQEDPIGFVALRVGSEMYREGLKIVQPSGDQCQALEHVKINLTFEEYEQPYPLTVVKLPESFQDSMKKKYNVCCPPYVASYHEQNSGALFLVSFDPNTYGELWTTAVALKNRRFSHMARFFRPEPEQMLEIQLDGSTEELLGHTGLEEGEGPMMLAVSRVVLNTCLMLTYLGVQNMGNPEIAKLKGRLQGKANSRAKRKAQNKARRLLEEAQDVQYIAFQQQIDFCATEGPTRSSSESGRTHASPKPHWRKGHFKRVPCGPGRTQRRKVFIKPVMVRKDRYVGSMADTETSYNQS